MTPPLFFARGFDILKRPMHKILLVEDSIEIHELIRCALGASHDLTIVSSVFNAKEAIQSHQFDLVVVDLNLPDGDGIAILSLLQSMPADVAPAVIICSTRNSVEDRVLGFQLGTDDYIPKPIDLREFKVRIESKLKKLSQQHEKTIITDNIEVMQSSHRVFLNPAPDLNEHVTARTEVFLTSSEYRLLLAFVKNKDRVMQREQLIDSLWGADKSISDRAIDFHIAALRKKLGVHGKAIRTIYGYGYVYEST